VLPASPNRACKAWAPNRGSVWSNPALQRCFRLIAVVLAVFVSPSRCHPQGMATAFSANGHLAAPTAQKTAAQLLSDLRSARAALTAHPLSAQVYVCLGLALQALKQPDAASKAFDQAIALKPNLPEPLYQRGVLSTDKEQWSEAEQLFRRAIAVDASYLPARLGLAEMLLRSGDFDGAGQELNAAVGLDSHNSSAHYGLGLVHLQKGEFDAATGEFRLALSLRPGYLEAQKNLAEAFILQGKWNDAVALLKHVVAADPHSGESVTTYARALENSGYQSEAQQQFTRARQLSRDEANLFRAKAESNFGVSLRNQGKFPEAIAAFRRAIEASPDFCEAHDDLGGVLWQQQDFAAATTEFASAVHCNPDFASARNNLGIAMLYYRHDLDQAIAQFQGAIDANPGFALAHVNLGKSLATKGQFPEAESEFRSAIVLAPDMAVAHLGLGLLLAVSTGNVSSEARAEMNEGLRLDPTLKTAIPAQFAAQLN
jgi:tetratricopeptide (TPR) repeat protein